jgi:hypothetical protein
MHSLLLGINNNAVLYMIILDELVLQFGIIPLKQVPVMNYKVGPVPLQLVDRLWISLFVMLSRTTSDST